MDVGTLADLLHETAEHHDRFEKASRNCQYLWMKIF